MHNTDKEPITEETSIAKDMLRLYDDFTEFNDRCAFLCDAFAAIVENHEYIDENTIHGLGSYSNWLKHQVGDFKTRLKHIHARARQECQ